MRNTFSLLFYANGSKKKDGLVPILCRITVSGTIAQFSCKLKVPCELWSPSTGRVSGKSRTAQNANNILDGIRSRITSTYHELAVVGRVHSARQLRDLYFGRSSDKSTLLMALKKMDDILSDRVGKDRSRSTLNKYRAVKKHLIDYLHRGLGRKDIFLTELDEDFLRGFCVFLREYAGVSQSSVWVYQMPLRTIARAAFNEGIITKNPFSSFHVSPDVKERKFLTESQLDKLTRYPYPAGNKYGFVRDMFVFCCNTGLSFVDLKNLKPEDIVEINGTFWIIARRQKTKINFQAKLLPKALEILKEYGTHEDGRPVFNIGNYCTVNNRLKRVGIDCGVSNNLTFHVARHTFATIALSKGMSMESLKSILGHTDIHTTEIYAKITTKRLEKDYSLLSPVSKSLPNYKPV